MPDPKKKRNKYRVEESEEDQAPSENPSSVSAVSSLNEEEQHFA